jgi:hypothetical protein
MKKKLVLLLLTLSSLSFAQTFHTAGAGDGTLPVLRSVRVRFLDGPLFNLPTSRTLVINKKLVPGTTIVKEAFFIAARIMQRFSISTDSNFLTTVKIKTKSENVVLKNTIVNAGQLEALNQIDSNAGTIVQKIELNLK